MRHLLLALMIVLLPVRGWMGDAMALSMLAPPAQGLHHAAASDTGATLPTAHAQEHDHGATGSADGAAAVLHDSGTDHTHKSCEVCNGPAMALSLPTVPALPTTHGLLAPPAERFASSEPHRSIKPPIS
jgi:hypothetical protein